MMRVPKRLSGMGIDAANQSWIKIAHNDWVLITGTNMGFYYMTGILPNSWEFHLRRCLEEMTK
jgi:hypothetical protein